LALKLSPAILGWGPVGQGRGSGACSPPTRKAFRCCRCSAVYLHRLGPGEGGRRQGVVLRVLPLARARKRPARSSSRLVPSGDVGRGALTLRHDTTSRRWGTTGMGGQGVSVASAGASRTMPSQPLVARSSPRGRERRYGRAVIGIDAITSLVPGVTAYDVRFGDPSAHDLQWDESVALSASLPLQWPAAVAELVATRPASCRSDSRSSVASLRPAVVVIATVATAAWATTAETGREISGR
jgi:hypothetical protein